MEKQFVIQIVAQYLNKDDIHTKLILLSKKINKYMSQIIMRSNPNYKVKKEYFNKIRSAPDCNITMKAYGIKDMPSGCFRFVKEWEIVYIYILAFPICYEGHEVGVRFTSDNWKNFRDSKAFWIGNQDDCEVWKVDVSLFNVGCLTDFEFAIYGKNIKGKWSWDNNKGKNFKIEFPRLYYGFLYTK